MEARGLEHTASAAASLYSDLVDFFVIDEADQEEVTRIHALGMTPIVSRTLTHVNPVFGRDLVCAVTSPMRLPAPTRGAKLR